MTTSATFNNTALSGTVISRSPDKVKVARQEQRLFGNPGATQLVGGLHRRAVGQAHGGGDAVAFEDGEEVEGHPAGPHQRDAEDEEGQGAGDGHVAEAQHPAEARLVDALDEALEPGINYAASIVGDMRSLDGDVIPGGSYYLNLSLTTDTDITITIIGLDS